MNLNGINPYSYNSYDSYYNSTASQTRSASNNVDTVKTETAVSTYPDNSYSAPAAVYEPSEAGSEYYAGKLTGITTKMRSDNAKEVIQMQSYVANTFLKQGIVAGTAASSWKVLSGGGSASSGASIIARAKTDISKNGYWGIEQTSDRVMSYAKKLSGGNKSVMNELAKSVAHSYSESTQNSNSYAAALASDTYNSINFKFDQWFNQN